MSNFAQSGLPECSILKAERRNGFGAFPVSAALIGSLGRQIRVGAPAIAFRPTRSPGGIIMGMQTEATKSRPSLWPALDLLLARGKDTRFIACGTAVVACA